MVFLMQEEIENKTINLAISTTKLTARTVINAGRAYLQNRSRRSSCGKQSIKKLVGQNKGVTNIEIEKTGIRGFERYAKNTASTLPSPKTSQPSHPSIWSFSRPRTAML